MDEMMRCEELEMHPHLMDHARAGMPSEDALCALSELYKVFGDSTRLRILYVLYETELCVCDIAGVCGMTVSAISHQLRILKQSRLVKFRKVGKSAFYSLADEHVHSILSQGMDHVREIRPLLEFDNEKGERL